MYLAMECNSFARKCAVIYMKACPKGRGIFGFQARRQRCNNASGGLTPPDALLFTGYL
jgi:hypothetical protein